MKTKQTKQKRRKIVTQEPVCPECGLTYTQGYRPGVKCPNCDYDN